MEWKSDAVCIAEAGKALILTILGSFIVLGLAYAMFL